MIINLSKTNKYITDAQLTHNVHDESTMSITCIKGFPPLQYEEDVEFVYRGVTVLKGQVDSISRTLTGMTEETTYTIVDGWRKLRAPYLTKTGLVSTVCGMSADGKGGNGGKVSVLKSLQGLLDKAKLAGLIHDYVINISQTAKMVPFVASASSYADLIRSILQWRPNSSSWFDYSTGNAILHICDHSNLEAVNIDVNEMLTTDITLTPRYDMRPNAVMFVLSQTNNFGGYVYVQNIAPTGANPNQPNVLYCQVDGDSVGRTTDPDVQQAEEADATDESIQPPSGWSMDKNANAQTIRGRAVPAGQTGARCADFWVSKLPELDKIKTALQFKPMTATGLACPDNPSPKNYDINATSHEVVEGQFSDTTKIKHCITEVSQYIYVSQNIPAELRGYFPLIGNINGTYVRYGKFKVSIRTMDRSRYNYIINKNEVEIPNDVYDDLDKEEDEAENLDNVNNAVPDSLFNGYYNEIVNELYNETRTLQYDGSLSLRNIPVKSYIGKKINITGLADYMTSINSNASSLSIDYTAKTASLTLGAPTHLSIQDMLSRSKALQEMQTATLISQVDNNANDEDKPTQTRQRPQWSAEYDNEARNPKSRAKNPSFGPWSSTVGHSKTIEPANGSFALGAVLNENGTVDKVLIKQGNLIFPKGKVIEVPTGLNTAIGGYLDTGLGACRVYLNYYLTVDAGVITVSNTTITNERAPDTQTLLYEEWGGDPQNPNPATKTGIYSVEIGEVTTSGEIKQVQIGDIYVPIVSASTSFPV